MLLQNKLECERQCFLRRGLEKGFFLIGLQIIESHVAS
ncbi:conserved hypothetical protein [delta proteobacterium NaphS2]|nr:conserved hypothetical protein [delta proteobacterium NaphS2]